ncbi:hypothetical protein BAE44_0011502 [Dichanthelium oligosanthes]|uniref:FAD-binding domain-containing protein n=1 Tax=Dichanthelium oligosanthes TaxID=888268 RepID=A0A1E5VQT6_9POAL|nr:hypothetical protein BAE44_0011502 [Dichanthelium oligosanthes]
MPAGAAAAAATDLDVEVAIAGGGIAGLATALALRRAGAARGSRARGSMVVLERHAELRATGAALTIFPNGWFALRALGVAHKLTSRYNAYETCHQRRRALLGFAMLARLMCLSEVGGQEGTAGGASRGAAAGHSSKLVSIDTERVPGDSSETVVLRLDDGTVLIGCDGMHSVVARWLGLSEPASEVTAHATRRLSELIDSEVRSAAASVLAEKDAAGDPTKTLHEVTDNLASHMPRSTWTWRHSDHGNLSVGAAAVPEPTVHPHGRGGARSRDGSRRRVPTR